MKFIKTFLDMEKEKNQNSIEKNIYDLLTGNALEFSIKLEKRSLYDRLIKRKEKTYKIQSIVLKDYFKVAEILDNCKELIIPDKENEILINSIDAIRKYHKQIVEIIAVFLKEKKKFIYNNLDFIDLQRLLIKIIEYNKFDQFFFILDLAKKRLTIRNPED